MKNAGMPELKFVSTFTPGTPASLAGDVPIPFGWPKTLYRNQPKRKSVSSVGLQVVIEAAGDRVIARVRSPGVSAGRAGCIQARTRRRPARTSPGATMRKSCDGVAAEDVDLLGRVVIDANVEGVVIEFNAARGSEVRLVRAPHWYSAAGISFRRFCACGESRLAGIVSPGNCVRVAGGPVSGSKMLTPVALRSPVRSAAEGTRSSVPPPVLRRVP